MTKRIKIVNHAKRQAAATMLVPVMPSFLFSSPSTNPAALASNPVDLPATASHKAEHSPSPIDANNDQHIATFDTLLPSEDDYVRPTFRALSAAVIPGYWLDYTTPGVLEASTQLLTGQTVYKNHDFTDVEGWIGVVERANWDQRGVQSGGVPGINVEMKIDWRMNPRIARGLLMQPPAIHSASVTVLFEFDYSHPTLIEQGTFWDQLGDEVDGQLVRVLVTKILGYWEISLVFQGADLLAKQIHGSQSQSTDLLPSASIPAGENSSSGELVLTRERATTIGLEIPSGEPFTEQAIEAQINQLVRDAAMGARLLQSARDEAKRLVRIAEDADAAASIELIIDTASLEQLRSITTLYSDRAAERFPHTCQSCGASNRLIRSSIETGHEQAHADRAPVMANSLH